MTKRLSRRGFLGACGIGLAGLGVGAVAGRALDGDGPPSEPGDGAPSAPAGPAFAAGDPVAVHGDHQAGIARPATAQPFGYVLALDTAAPDPSFLPALGQAIAALLDPAGPADEAATRLLPSGPLDTTVTVGLGPRLVAAVDPALPGAQALPPFATDATVDPALSDGDVLLAVYGSDPTILRPLAEHLAGTIPYSSIRWALRVFRGPSDGTITRNPFGFLDGIVVSSTDEQLAENVWINESDDARAAGGTILCLRRFSLDVDGFDALTTAEQEALVGRRRTGGEPLSGGGRDDQVDLLAKTPDGQYVTPARAHARAAHPSTTGSGLMLRRSYTFDAGPAGVGLLFVSFQRELRSFSATLQRMEERDGMLPYCTALGGGTWLVLPGYSDGIALGSRLLGQR